MEMEGSLSFLPCIKNKGLILPLLPLGAMRLSYADDQGQDYTASLLRPGPLTLVQAGAQSWQKAADMAPNACLPLQSVSVFWSNA